MIKKQTSKCISALVFSIFLPLPALTQEVELLGEVTALNDQLVEVDGVISQYSGGIIFDLATARREALLLAKTLAENRIKAERGEAGIEVTVLATQPDDEKATQLLGEMASAQTRIETAKSESSSAGGLLQALALSRLETERLTLAQLQMGYLQAKYGIAFPVSRGTAPSTPLPNEGNSNEEIASPEAEPDLVAWADSRFPEIDYSLAPFERAHRDNLQVSGWWTIETKRAAIDDSPLVTAINYSAYDAQDFGGLTAVMARCTEGNTAFIFLQDEFLISDFQRRSFDMTVRISDKTASKSRWSGLTNSKGAGLFGAEAEIFLRSIYDADKLFLRLTDKNGQNHDASFSLEGASDSIEAVAAACGWSTLNLSVDDYKAIQTLLNAGGFEAGTPDGKWGVGSQTAMKKFQESIDLPQTGAADRATLKKLGFSE